MIRVISRTDGPVRLYRLLWAILVMVSAAIRLSSPAEAGSPPGRGLAQEGSFGASHVVSLVPVDWPQFHFDVTRAGYNPFETVLSPETVGSMTNRWQRSTPGIVNTAPAVWHGNVYVAVTGDSGNGRILAFNAVTGAQRWVQKPEAGTVDDLAVSKGTVYAGTASNGLIAYDARTGAVRWTYPTGGVVKPPAIVGGVAYINVSPDQLIALDARTGQELWVADRGFGTSISAPAIADGKIFLCGPPLGLGISAFDAADGTKLWEYETGDLVEGTPAVVNGIVYASSGDGYMYALDAATGDLVWQRRLNDGSGSTPAVANGIVYIGAEDGVLYALDALTGDPIWSAPTGALFALGSPSIANGVVYVETDGFHAYDAVGGAELWSYEAPLTNAAPAVANGLAYFGAGTTLYAFGLP